MGLVMETRDEIDHLLGQRRSRMELVESARTCGVRRTRRAPPSSRWSSLRSGR
ncbi:hypothetical protein ACGFNU_15840 [Spirillospora sp. NPDC048911]|uniref:hypothetical protein n=1 Tax=Spirillospora sp. NPDC048911 TaxID=3364527 RepID=UPI00370FFFD0